MSYSSYISSALTTASNKYTALRRGLLNDDNDGDTEDDTHVCRVLRAYYTEKGRQFPEWLPPDPKAPVPQAASMVSSTRRPQPGGYGQSQRTSGGLSDLWGSEASGGSSQQAPSLRAGRAGNMADNQSLAGGRPSMPSKGGFVDSYQRSGASYQSNLQEPRPLPSQRAGSYQASLRAPSLEQTPSGSSGGASSAQDRLKAKLWGGGRSGSSAQTPPRSTSPGISNTGSRNQYEPASARAPAPAPAPAPASMPSYDGGRHTGAAPSANAPWSGGGQEYSGYSAGSGYGSSGNPYGSSNNNPYGSGSGGSGASNGLRRGPRPQR